KHHETDAATGNRLSPSQATMLDRYLTSHQGHARYEVATLNIWQAAPLITASARPVLVLRNVNFRPMISPSRLSRAVRAGELRYVLLGSDCSGPINTSHFQNRCPPAARWARQHGREVLVSGHSLGLYDVKR